MSRDLEKTLLDCYELNIEKFDRYEDIYVYTKYWFFSWLKRYKKTYKRKYFDYHIIAKPRKRKMEFWIFSKPMLTVWPEMCKPVACEKKVIELEKFSIYIWGIQFLDFKVAKRVAWKIWPITKSYETHFFVPDFKSLEEWLYQWRLKLGYDLKQHISKKLWN